jgi:uncharacterized protein YecT (DUF1311 family)
MSGARSGTASWALALAAMAVIAAGLLAGCGGSSSSTAGGATQGTTAPASAAGTATSPAAPSSAAPSSAAASTAAPSSAAAFVPITEPFDPGHPARTTTEPASCVGQQTTLAIEQCYNGKAETADAAIDAVQQASFATATAAQQAAINAADSAWLAARSPVCEKAYNTGGTIDGINIAICQFDESTARLDAVKNITPPEAMLKSTDSQSLSDVSWYTTPEGSRIGLVDTQGDMTGGVIIEWIVIAGAEGFTVNPAQFFYSDGAFTDAGIIEKPDPSGHRVTAGTEYTFGIDYSTLPHDPNEAKGTGGYVYAPGAPVAVWR